MKGLNVDSPVFEMTRHYLASQRVIRDEMSEKEYIKEFLHSNSDYVSNPLLRLSPTEFYHFFQKLSKMGRREYLMVTFEYSYRELSKLLGYKNHNLIQSFFENFTKNMNLKFLSELAIVFRVPPDWLTENEITPRWETYHFHHLGKKPITQDEFLHEIMETKNKDNWIRIYIVRGQMNSSFLYIRVEAVRGNLLVEYFNEQSVLADFHRMSVALHKRFRCVDGNITTVVPGQRNAATVCIAYDHPFSLPIGFNG